MSRPRSRPRLWMLTSVHPALDARIFYREARSASVAGYEVTILAPGRGDGAVDGVTLRGLPGPRGRLGRLVRWPILLALAARARADLYQLHDPELLPWGLLLQGLTGRPVIYDAHEFLAESILTKRWIPRPLRRPTAWLADRIEKGTAARLAAVVAVTPEMAARFVPLQPRTVTVMNFPLTGPEVAAVDDRAPIAIYVGLMNIERGLGVLLRTAQLVRQRHPTFEMWVLGPVDWQGLPSEGAGSPETWHDAGVRFLGSVPQPEVASQLARARIGWLPMNPTVPGKRLAWPMKMGEYMAAGLPIVASDLPVQTSVITAAECGIVVPAFRPELHAAAISDLLDDRDRARRMGERGQAYARDHLSWERQAVILTDLYSALLRGAAGEKRQGSRSRSARDNAR